MIPLTDRQVEDELAKIITTKATVLKLAQTNPIVNAAFMAYPDDWNKAMISAVICLAKQNDELVGLSHFLMRESRQGDL